MVEKAPTPERIDKERAIVELRTEGYVWREIAQQISDGTIDRQNAISAVAEALGVDEYSTGAGLNLKSIETDIDLLSILIETFDPDNKLGT